MHGNVTDEEWEIFREAFRFFSNHCDPPANQRENAVEWWTDAAKEVCALDQKWAACPLMREMLIAIYSYIESKAKEKTKELAEFVQES